MPFSADGSLLPPIRPFVDTLVVFFQQVSVDDTQFFGDILGPRFGFALGLFVGLLSSGRKSQ